MGKGVKELSPHPPEPEININRLKFTNVKRIVKHYLDTGTEKYKEQLN